MAAKKLKVPYPPSPTDVPPDLTDFPETYIRQQNLLLAGLFVFLILYIGAIILFAMVGLWCALTLEDLFVVKLLGMILCGTFFLYLVKGFFKRHPIDKEMHIEITEEEQPVLFEFIHRICEELGAPEPNRVFVSPDVNAAVIPRTSLINLFVEPKKDLLIGLGLVNCINLSEFKSVMAHEFGHFSQSGMASGYAYVCHRIIVDLIEGEDWFDRTLNWCKRQENALSLLGYGIGGCLYVGRMILWWILKTITLQRLAVMRESEFHADLLAVKAAGSDAVALSLFRMRFGNLCLGQAVEDLATALDHKLYSNDIFLHQDRAAVVVRRKKKDNQFGLPPVHDGPMAGKKIQIFDPDDEDLADDIPEMRRTHPPAYELEENAKETFIPAVVDHRSPWILFTDAAELRERLSYKFYRMVFRIPKGSELTDAKKVQEYIDNEHADTTYDPKYCGAYDDRPIEPGELSELNALVADSPWTEERLEKVLDKLYDGCEEHAEAHAELHKEMTALNANAVGRPKGKLKKKIDDCQEKMDENWEWFKSFDRRVYLLHVQLADKVKPAWKDELVERYRFQMEVQRIYQEARHNFNKADAYIAAYHAAVRGEIEVPGDFGGEVISVLRSAWKVLKGIIKDAREINLPAMTNFVEGDNLADFILEGKLVPEPPLTELKGVWVHKLMNQLLSVKNKCFRLHFKSLGGILALQEKIAASWTQAKTNVAAGVENLVADVDSPEVVDEDDLVEVEMMPTDVRLADNVPGVHIPKGFLFERLKLDDEPVEAAQVVEVVEVVEAAEVVEVVEVAEVVEDAPAQAKPTEFVVPAVPASTAAEAAPAMVAFRAPPAQPSAQADGSFSLDLDAAAAPAVQPAEEVFSLDADELAAKAKAKATPAIVPPPAPRPGPPVGADEVFRLDADAKPTPAAPTPKPEPVVAAAVAEPAPKPASGATATPGSRPQFGSGSHAAIGLSREIPNGATKGRPKRPAVKITFVKPGDTSPFAK
jgi:Zn-dependent protease with chaperone function